MLLPGAAAETIDHIFGILVSSCVGIFIVSATFSGTTMSLLSFVLTGGHLDSAITVLLINIHFFQFWFAVIHQFLPPKLVVHFVNTSDFKHVCCTVRLRTSSWEWGPVAMTPPAGLESDFLYMWRNTVQTDGRTET